MLTAEITFRRDDGIVLYTDIIPVTLKGGTCSFFTPVADPQTGLVLNGYTLNFSVLPVQFFPPPDAPRIVDAA